MVKDKLNIIMASSEMEPFARTGGLGDVTAALCKRLAGMGHEVKMFIPKYKSVYQTGIKAKPSGQNIDIKIGEKSFRITWETYTDKAAGFEVVFIVNDDLYMRETIYHDSRTGLDYPDNDERFILLSRAALEITKKINWRPDIAHAHDWQTSLITVFLRTMYSGDPFFEKTRSLLTLHNVAYQGSFDSSSLSKLNLNGEAEGRTRAFKSGGKVNFLKAGINFADIISAVSERYAVEIQTSREFGFGLEQTLRNRNSDIYAALNGVDYDIWNPATDKLISPNYDADKLEGKAKNKKALLEKLGFIKPKEKITERRPLIGTISRLVDQKGIDLFLEIADDILGLDVYMIALGEGEQKYATALRDLERKHPDNFRAVIGFDNKLAHQIEASADIFLMPSKYEPCGLNQLYSLRYGAVPIVRETGGLADTVSDYNAQTGEGVGFVFKNYSSDELLEACCRALDLYHDENAWSALVKRGMALDFSWESSVNTYIELYRLALGCDRESQKTDTQEVVAT